MDNAKFWDRLARNYDDEVGEETTAITRKYLRENDTVLDYGCARGSYTLALAGDVKEIRGVDISPEMIKRASAHSDSIRFDTGTIFDIDETFDVVLAFNILHLVEDTERVLEKIDQILKPGGRFVSVTTCMNAQLLLRIAAFFTRLFGVLYLRGFTTSELEDLISRRFEIAEVKKFTDHHILIVAKKTEF